MKSEQSWQAMQELLSGGHIIIDRPINQHHPRYPDLLYPFDYGYIKGTTSGAGDGIDIWIGSLNNRTLTGILCTFDTVKRDAEIKLLAGCTPRDVETIQGFNQHFMHYLFIPKPKGIQ